MTAKAIEASSAMLVTNIAVAIISTTTPDHVGVRAPKERYRRSSSDGLDDLTRLPHGCALGGRYAPHGSAFDRSAGAEDAERRHQREQGSHARHDLDCSPNVSYAGRLTANVDVASTSPARQIATRVLGAVRPGSIVILHDGGGDRTATLNALPMIIKGIRHKGLHLVGIDG